jgi:hypothetical protein
MKRFLLLGLLATTAMAAPKKPVPKPVKAAPSAEPVKPPLPTTKPPPPVAKTVGELLAEAQRQYDALEYSAVVPLTRAALGSPDISAADKRKAYELEGSALVIVGDPIEAKKSFYLLLNDDPDFSLPASTPPKIKDVFSSVKNDVRVVLEEKARRERAKIAAEVIVTGDPLTDAAGGRPIKFHYRVSDPRGIIKTVRVQYRKVGEPDFQALSLVRDPEGGWKGAITGEWTANEGGFVMQYFASAADAVGVLTTHGSDQAPNVVNVSAGQVDRINRPIPLWAFVTSAVSTGVVGLAGGALGAGTLLQQSRYNGELDAARATQRPASGAKLREIADLGETLETSQFVAYGVAGVGVIVTGLLSVFTNWTGEDELGDEAAAPEAATAPAR